MDTTGNRRATRHRLELSQGFISDQPYKRVLTLHSARGRRKRIGKIFDLGGRRFEAFAGMRLVGTFTSLTAAIRACKG